MGHKYQIYLLSDSTDETLNKIYIARKLVLETAASVIRIYKIKKR